MDNVLEFVKRNKIIILVMIFILAIALVGIFLYVNNTKMKYEIKEITEYNYYLLKTKDSKIGVIDKFGKIIITPDTQNIIIPNPEKAVFICENNGKTTVLNEKAETLFKQFEEVKQIDIKGIVSSIPYEKSVLKYKKDGKYGLITYEGKIITKPVYDEIDALENKEGEMLIKKNEKYGVINSKGVTIINPEYDTIVADGYYIEEQKYALSGYIVGIKTRRRVSLWLYKS